MLRTPFSSTYLAQYDLILKFPIWLRVCNYSFSFNKEQTKTLFLKTAANYSLSFAFTDTRLAKVGCVTVCRQTGWFPEFPLVHSSTLPLSLYPKCWTSVCLPLLLLLLLLFGTWKFVTRPKQRTDTAWLGSLQFTVGDAFNCTRTRSVDVCMNLCMCDNHNLR